MSQGKSVTEPKKGAWIITERVVKNAVQYLNDALRDRAKIKSKADTDRDRREVTAVISVVEVVVPREIVVEDLKVTARVTVLCPQTSTHPRKAKGLVESKN